MFSGLTSLALVSFLPTGLTQCLGVVTAHTETYHHGKTEQQTQARDTTWPEGEHGVHWPRAAGVVQGGNILRHAQMPLKSIWVLKSHKMYFIALASKISNQVSTNYARSFLRTNYTTETFCIYFFGFHCERINLKVFYLFIYLFLLENLRVYLFSNRNI